MKYSIKRQMIVVFIGLGVCLILGMFIINVNFLESYYVHSKASEFVSMYEGLRKAMEEDAFEDTLVMSEVHRTAEMNNISYLVIDNRNNQVITNVHDRDMLKNQLLGYLLNQVQKDGKVLESTENYQLGQTRDPWNQREYIEMWGSFDDGSQFLLRSPLESIRESAAISNRFLIYIGCIMIGICVCLVWYFSRRLTEPIRELARLSDKMANLDFEVKYTSGGVDEIGELGENFNRMSEKLQSTISELKRANNSLKKDIEKKDKLEQMRSEFMGNVSHELKTPIALIQGYAEGLKEGVKEDSESREFYCDVIIDEAAKMNQMVKNLMTLNQLEFGNEEIEFERFDITAMISGVLQSMDILAQQKQAEVIFRADSPTYVWADEFKAEQVVRNYISNALNHLSGERVVEVKITVMEGKARISVFNTGTPIPEESLAYIWDKFYKVDKAHTREYGGNGIGLSIVKAIMESFHQEYGVRNYDNGVEFWFELDV